jgi:NAD(P)-dependent dehydrogenase (short-subunit alcohol dehydrogenase family)
VTTPGRSAASSARPSSGSAGSHAADGGAPRVVLITGASSGIGLATAHAAATHGDHVVLVARGAEALERAAEECRSRGAASATPRPVDVGDSAAVTTLVDDVLREHGRIDAVVLAAGVVGYGRFENVPAEVFDRVLRTNVSGVANVVRAVLPGMRAADDGSIVIVGSLLGQIAPPYMSPYAVSKWAVRELTRILRIENRDRRGVRISSVSPGGVDTPIYVQGANYLGWVGRPPPPVMSSESVARAIMHTIDHPRALVQVGPANRFTMLGFTLLPWVYDALVTPLFEIAAADTRQPVAPGDGNAFASQQDLNRLRGEQGSVVVSVAAGARNWVRRRLSR